MLLINCWKVSIVFFVTYYRSSQIKQDSTFHPDAVSSNVNFWLVLDIVTKQISFKQPFLFYKHIQVRQNVKLG